MKRDRMTLVATMVVALLLLVTVGASRASADTITYTLTAGNVSGLGCCSGPYATVTVDLTNSTTANITFDSLTNGGYIYLMGGQNGAAVNSNGTATVSNFGGSNSLGGGFSPGTLSDGGSGTMDGFGNFSNTISVFDGFKSSYTEITFTLTLASGTWSSAANVLSGNIAAIHGFACVLPCTSTSGAFATGYAGNAAVPDGGMTLMLLGGTLVGIETLRRKFRV